MAMSTSAHVADLIINGRHERHLERSRLERHFRDAQKVRHHGFLSESRFETAAQVHLGVEPEFGFVAF